MEGIEVPRGVFPEALRLKVGRLARTLNVNPAEAIEIAIDYFWAECDSPPPNLDERLCLQEALD